MSNDIELGIVLKADGSGLVGEVRLSKAELKKLKGSADTAARGLDNYDKKTRKASKSSSKFKGISKGLGRELNALKGVLGGLNSGGVAVTAMLAASTVKMISVARQTERMTAQLRTMTGSMSLANLEFDRLNKFATQTPFTLQQSVDAFVKLKALGLDPSERAMLSYGNTASAMGKDMMQMIEAVADASTGEFERLKEFGIKARQHGDQVTFTFRGIETTVQNSSENIQQYLLNIGETDFAGAMANQMDTIDGKTSNMEQAFNDLWREMGKGLGISDKVKSVLDTVSEAINAVTREVKDLFWAINQTEFTKVKAEIAQLEDSLNTFADNQGKYNEAALKGILPGIREQAKELIKLKKRYRELNQELGNARPDAATSSSQTGSVKTGPSSGGVARASIKKAGVFDAHVKAQQKYYESLLNDRDRLIESLKDEGDRYLDNMDKLDLLYAKGLVTEEQYQELAAKLHESFDGAADDLIDTTDRLSEQASVVKDSFKSAFKDIVKNGEIDFDRLTQSIANKFIDIAVDDIFNQMFSNIGGGGAGGIGSGFGSLFSGIGDFFSGIFSANGNAFSQGELLAFANGGVVGSPTFFGLNNGLGVMGEAGPEAIMPLKRGANGQLGVQLFSNSKSSAAAIPANVTVVVQNNAANTDSRIEQSKDGNGNDLITVLIDEVDNALATRVNRGSGALPESLEGTYGLNRSAGSVR